MAQMFDVPLGHRSERNEFLCQAGLSVKASQQALEKGKQPLA
jgi:hypothetical protein